ncbi:hypothetical protein CCHL11_00295 [Colletotrichum chlorophyti]|uniref:BTB domain-containing protein n=1 Tax=Colletotrichum chlorophyti TaxID=708187 RepID=A0A1Q8RU81_9PEZI|nr:hypothetical protein CCHL11_00295 [Colletotrichum chlorophyti]
MVVEVSGRRFNTSTQVLSRSPYFQELFSAHLPNWYRYGALHIDDDPDLFAHILRFLRTGTYPLYWNPETSFDYGLYAMMRQQAQKYMLFKLEAWIADRKYLEVVETHVTHRKMGVPHGQDWVSEECWNGDGSYEISEIVGYSGADSSPRRGDKDEFKFRHADSASGNGKTDSKEREFRDGGVIFMVKEKKTKVNVDLLRCDEY